MPKKLNSEEWVIKAKQIHEDKYDYSKVEYINQSTPVFLICLVHNNSFKYSPRLHLKSISGGCKVCEKERRVVVSKDPSRKKPSSRKKSNEQYIVESKALHGDKYGYDRCIYKGTHEIVELYCNTCKDYFKTYAGDHIRKDKACGCPVCGLRDRKPRVSKTTYDVLVKKIKERWESFGHINFEQYVIENDRKLYPRNKESFINIYCKKHKTTSSRSLNDVFKSTRKFSMCDECLVESNRTPKEVLLKELEYAKEYFNNYYDYSLIDIDNFKGLNHPIIIVCPKHGEVPITWDRHFKRLNHCNKCSKSYTLEDVLSVIEKSKKDFISTKYLKVETNSSNFVKNYVLKDMYCTLHNKKFNQTYNAFRDGYIGCPSCTNSKTSKKEKELVEWLRKILPDNIIKENYKPRWLKFDGGRTKELDIYIPELSLAIEYNGTYYHSIEFDPKFLDYHQKKYEVCKTNNVNLIHIFEFENLDKWKRKLINYFLEPNKYSINYNNIKRTVEGYTCYGQSYIKRTF